MPTPDELLAEAKLKSEVEWGTYVATSVIHIDGARAFNPGDAVPVSHVTRGVVDSVDVEKVASPPKATKAAVAAAAEKKD